MDENVAMPPERTEKTADRPHRMTVTLSVLAVGISILSYYTSSRALSLNELGSRAVVEVTDVRYDKKAHDGPSNKNPRLLPFEVVLTNLGKTEALSLRAGAYIATERKGKILGQRWPWLNLSNATLGPGRSTVINTLYEAPYLPDDLIQNEARVLIFGVINYYDPVRQRKIVERWCYEFPSGINLENRLEVCSATDELFKEEEPEKKPSH